MVDNPAYSKHEEKRPRHSHPTQPPAHHQRVYTHRGRPTTATTATTRTTTMSSNGSTKHIITDPNTPQGTPRNNRTMVPPEIRHYPANYESYEASRYEPNFMLGYGAPQHPQYPREAPRRVENQVESRRMRRPKDMKGNLDPRLFLHPPTPELPRTFGYGGVEKGRDGVGYEGGPMGSYDWHIPRASLWCFHKGYAAEECKECQWKQQERGVDVGSDITPGSLSVGNQLGLPSGLPGGLPGGGGGGGGVDGVSMCSSINPPPTFTAMDNYRPVRPRRPRCRHCSCGIIFAITTVFSLLVLVLIAAFIIYVEMVLKHQTTTPMDRM